MIDKILLADFRNINKKVFNFSPKITVIVGPNASGKTNIIESVFLLSSGKSFKARVEEEMVNYDKEIARVKGKTKEEILEVVLTRGEINIGAKRREKVARKRLLVNGVGKRMVDFGGRIRVVLFGPWDLGLVTRSPSTRRKLLDTILSQVDRDYQRAILSYEKGLRRRNKILLRIREEGVSRTNLIFWDKLLIKNGDYVSRRRQDFIDFVNKQPRIDNPRLSHNSSKSLITAPINRSLNKTEPINSQIFELEYDKSAISQARLEQYEREEVAAATTLVGPHRDDFIFRLGKRNLARYGSRGEQRMGVLWLKLAELAFTEKETGEKPTLLLDDIFSELDHEHREVVMRASRGQQTIITTADPHFVKDFGKVEKIKLS